MNKKKKLLFTILTLLFISGCKAEVKINLNADRIKEEIVIKDKGNFLFDNKAKTYLKDNKNQLYNYKTTNTSNLFETSAKLYRTLKMNRVTSDNWDSKLGNVFYFHFDDGTLAFAYEKIKVFDVYPELDEVIIKIKTKNVIVEHNADSVKNGLLTWKLDRNIDQTKSIFVNVNDEIDESVTEGEDYTVSIILSILAVVIVLVLVFIFGYLYIVVKGRQSNKI